jgi:hypothetical protein
LLQFDPLGDERIRALAARRPHPERRTRFCLAGYIGGRCSARLGTGLPEGSQRIQNGSTLIKAIWSPARTHCQARGNAGSARRTRRTSGDSNAAAASAHPLVFHKAAPRGPSRRHAGCTQRARGRRGLSHRRYGPDPRAPPARSASHNASTPLVPSAHRGHSAPAASYGGSRTATADAPSRAHLSGLETTGRETSRAEGCRGWFLAGPPPPRCSGR